jgi:hypothetical protein
VVNEDGTLTIEVKGGLQAVHFFYFAPVLDASDRAELAKAVLRSKVTLSWFDWETSWELLRAKYGPEQNWLAEISQQDEFTAIECTLLDSLARHRAAHPTPRLVITTSTVPRFDSTSGILSFRSRTWRFRKQQGPVWELLCEMERRRFPASVHLKKLTPEQVREARRVLQRKTTPDIDWTAHADGYLSWRLGCDSA